jgi:hypothetical protein
MRLRLLSAPLALLGLASLSGTSSRAGTVISTNLSQGVVAIANINATQDGAQLTSQDIWKLPFSTTTIPTVTLPAGTYRFRIVNAVDALAISPSLTAAQQSQIFAGWTYNTPWIEDYLAFDAANNTVSQLFDGAPSPTSYTNPNAAYAGAKADGTFDDIRLGSRGNPTILSNYDYVVGTPTTFQFVIPDNGVGDNGGGVSVMISTVPEPTALGMGVPVVAAALLKRRRPRR